MQATYTRIMFPGAPLPRHSASPALTSAAQTRGVVKRSQEAGSSQAQQSALPAATQERDPASTTGTPQLHQPTKQPDHSNADNIGPLQSQMPAEDGTQLLVSAAMPKEQQSPEEPHHDIADDVSHELSHNSSSGSPFYSPAASEAGSESSQDSKGKVQDCLPTHKHNTSLAPHGHRAAASWPDSHQTEVLPGLN